MSVVGHHPLPATRRLSLPSGISDPTRKTRRFQCEHGAVPVQFQCSSSAVPGRFRPRSPLLGSRRNTRRAQRPAEPPAAPGEPEPRASGSASRLRRSWGRSPANWRPSTALDRRPYAGRQDGGQGRCGAFRGVRQRSRPLPIRRVPESQCPGITRSLFTGKPRLDSAAKGGTGSRQDD